MKQLKNINSKLMKSDDFKKILSREERKRILGGTGSGSNCATEIATTSHKCDPCGIDKDNSDGTPCCLTC